MPAMDPRIPTAVLPISWSQMLQTDSRQYSQIREQSAEPSLEHFLYVSRK